MPVPHEAIRNSEGIVCADVLRNKEGDNPIADILDRQHSKIKQKMQDFRIAILLGESMDQIIKCSKELIAITLRHFQSEESAMDAHKFEGLATHRHFHAEMIQSLKEFSSALEQRKISHAKELMRFFDERLAYHLTFEDGAFERALRNKQ